MNPTLKATFTAVILISCQFSFGQMRPNWHFRKEYLSNLLYPGDTIYISDRHHLEKLEGLLYSDSTAVLNSVSASKHYVSVLISAGKFQPVNHRLHLTDTVYKIIDNKKVVDEIIVKDIIDGKRAYGIEGGFPLYEIKVLRIKWNNRWLMINNDAYANLFDVHLNSTEMYLSPDKKLIYIYVSGSDGAGSYSAKFIFGKNGYITRIVSTNECTNGFDFLDAIPVDCE